METSTQFESAKTPPPQIDQEQERDLGQRLRDDGRQRIDEGRRNAARQVEEIASAVGAASSRLGSTQPTLAAYTADMAHGIERLAERMRDSTLEELASEARRFASRKPALFLLGGAALGVVLGRYLKLYADESNAADVEERERTTDSRGA